MPDSMIDEQARRKAAELHDEQLRLHGRLNTHEAVCDRDRIEAKEWRKSAIVILEDIKDSNSRAHDQIRRDLKEFIDNQNKTNGDLYLKLGQAETERASDHGKIIGASGVLAFIITVATTLLSSLIGWPHK